MSVDFNHFSGINAIFTLISAFVIAVITIAHNRRLTREELETSRKEWSDVATRRLELNKSLQQQIDQLTAQLHELTGSMGELRKENEFLRSRNVALQADLDGKQREIHQLQMDIRQTSGDMNRMERREERRHGGGEG